MNSTNTVSLKFLGAAGTVTGSKHLLKTPTLHVLIDCGLFQGLKTLRLKNREKLSVDESSIDAVILTHAHLDHCGYLPLLVRNGFNGRIYCTDPTRDLAEVILRDSARIQEEDAENANKKGYTRHRPALPLYTEKDVEHVLPAFVIVEAGEQVDLNEHISFSLHPNGHILGSAYVDLVCYGKRIVFSGDIGRRSSVLLPAPVKPNVADFVILESTYGDKLHPEVRVEDQLCDVIVDTIQQKGNLVIPSFAVGRAQELMHLLNELKKANRIPDVPVYLDSPMGAEATRVLNRHPGWHKLNAEQCNALFSDVTIIEKFDETMRVADLPGPKIIIAGSGMLNGGRVLFYLQKYITSRRHSILFTGYQAEGTRGRAMLRGAHEIKMYGDYFPVRMNIHSLSAMSGHGDQSELVDWLSQLGNARRIFLTHGENSAREAFRLKLQTIFTSEVILPQEGEEMVLFNA